MHFIIYPLEGNLNVGIRVMHSNVYRNFENQKLGKILLGFPDRI